MRNVLLYHILIGSLICKQNNDHDDEQFQLVSLYAEVLLE